MRKDSLERPTIVPEEAWEDAGEATRKCFVDLAARLGMNSSNSSLPPSSDRPEAQGTNSTGDHCAPPPQNLYVFTESRIGIRASVRIV